jgi:hypothetical protein
MHSFFPRALPEMESRIPYDDYPVVFLPAYENPPAWIPPHEVGTIIFPEWGIFA